MIHPENNKQLFLDDGAIHSMEGVTRTLHPPEKCGPVIRPDQSQNQTAVQSRSAPIWNPEKDIWEWWYWGYYTTEPYGPHRNTSISLSHYATSVDGLTWDTSPLGRFEWQGNRENNLALDPTEGNRTVYHILRDDRDPDPARRYKGLFSAGDRIVKVSPDGFVWTALDVPPVPSQDESHCTYDEQTEQFVATVKHKTNWGRSVWLCTSKNFEQWSKPELIFHSDDLDRKNRARRIREVAENPDYLSPPLIDGTNFIAEVYQMPILPYEGIYVGFPVLFNPAGAIPPPHMNYTALNQVELTTSRDLYQWDRVGNRALFIGVDPWDGVNYGCAQNLLCGRPHVRDDEIWIYYNAYRFRGPKELYGDVVDKTYHDDIGALSLAKLRLDGFVSLDAEQGTVITEPFEWAGGDLHANATIDGELRAELLDPETGGVMEGFEAGDCEPLQGDHLRARVAWKASPPLGRTVQVRFILRDASLYAFWTGQPS
jgi:hypothetical protein